MAEKSLRWIQTERLILREFSLEDLDIYAGIMGDDKAGRQFPKGKCYTREESTRS